MLRKKRVKRKFPNPPYIVTTPNQRKSSETPRRKTPVINDVSNDQLIKRLKVIQGLITNNINVGRNNKKSINVLSDRLREVETKLVLTYM